MNQFHFFPIEVPEPMWKMLNEFLFMQDPRINADELIPILVDILADLIYYGIKPIIEQKEEAKAREAEKEKKKEKKEGEEEK